MSHCKHGVAGGFLYRPHIYCVPDMRPFLHMSHVAWYVCLCVEQTDKPCKKDEPVDMPFGVTDWAQEKLR